MSSIRLIHKRLAPITQAKGPLEEIISTETTFCHIVCELAERLADPCNYQKLLAATNQIELDLMQENVATLKNNYFIQNEITPLNFVAKFRSLIKRNEFKQRILSIAKLTTLYEKNMIAINSDLQLVENKITSCFANVFQRPTRILSMLTDFKNKQYQNLNEPDKKSLNEILEIVKQLCVIINKHITGNVTFSELTSEIETLLASSYTDKPIEITHEKVEDHSEDLNYLLEKEITEVITADIENHDSITELNTLVSICSNNVRSLTTTPSSLPPSREGSLHEISLIPENQVEMTTILMFKNAILRLHRAKNISSTNGESGLLENQHRQVQFDQLINKFEAVLAIVEEEKAATNHINRTNKIVLNYLSILAMEIETDPASISNTSFDKKMDEIQDKLYGEKPMSVSLYSAVYAIISVLPAFCIAFWGNKFFRPHDENTRHILTGLLSAGIFSGMGAMWGYVNGKINHYYYNQGKQNHPLQTLRNKVMQTGGEVDTVVMISTENAIEHIPMSRVRKT